MKKLFTLAAALLASFSLSIMADTKIYTFDDDVALATDWNVTTNVPSGGTATCEITTSISSFPQETGSTNYLGLGYLNKSNIGIDITTTDSYENISEISIDAIASDNSKPTIAAYIVTSEGDVEVFAAIGTKDGFGTGGSGKWGKKTVTLATPVSGQLKIVTIASSSGKYAALDNISITYTPTATDPIATVTIAGPTEAAVGYAATYTATTDQTATEYKWFVDGAEQTGATKKTFEFTPATKGATYAIVCKARNDNNATDEWIASNTINVTGTKLCGELIKAVYDPDTKTSTVTGVIGGTADRNTQDNGKLGSNGHYYGAVLTSGSLMAGDVVTVKASALNGGNTATLFADKGETELGSAAFDETTLTAVITLTKSASAVYLYRKDSGCNPNIESISVTRSCEDSNDATIHSLTVNGNEVAENEGLFEYTLSASYEEPTVTIAFEIHPLATIKYGLSNPYEMTTPDLGDSRGQAFTIIAEDGTEKTYTVQIYKSAELSNDWHLKELSVEGYTLTPEFHPDTLIYHITRPYESANPAASAVTAVTRQEGATFVVNSNSNNFTINVTAENGSENAYVIWIDVAPAVKSLKQVKFANGFDAFIDNTNRTVKAFYLAGEAAPEATAIVAGNGTAGPLSEGKILVTGGDASEVEYTVTLEEVTPNTDVVEESDEAGAFDGTEAWVKNGLIVYGNTAGWVADGKYYVLRRQIKNSDAADDQRVIAGWVRTYLFVGNASRLDLTIANNNKIKYAIDGGEQVTSETNSVSIALEEGNHMIEIVTNQSSGDCRISAPKLVKRIPTALGETETEVKAVKIIRDGQLFIQKNGVLYNAQGAIVK